LTVRSRPPFRADHVGSLLRPASLFEARRAFSDGDLSSAELKTAEDGAIAEAVAMQEQVGLAVATDGEFRRSNWITDFVYRLEGVEPAGEQAVTAVLPDKPGRIETGGRAILFRVVDRVRLPETIFGADFQYLRSLTGAATPKLTIPSPSMIHFRSGRSAIDEAVYPELDEFWSDLANAYAEELRRLAELGCTYLQLDDVSLAYVNDPRQREHVRELGGDPERQHLSYLDCLNAVLANRPGEMAVTIHLCRGNIRSSWVAEGSYDFVAEPLFGGLDVDGFFLEYDDDRSGGFEPLRFLTKGKVVVLGLVTTKTGVLESKDDLKRRIEEASRFVDVEDLCLSPQCGFASASEGNQVTHDEQRAKLELVVETAQEVWG
jgi:5-methyltetrahydropteroyltriglutamate--homocysteine methyltransferase